MDIVNVEARTFEAMMTRFEALVKRVDTLCRTNDEKAMRQWLDNEDVCMMFDISKRTLQTYRDNGTLPHTRIGHKMFYKPDDIERIIPLIINHQKYKQQLNTQSK